MVGMWDGNISRPDSVADQRMSRQRTDDPIPHPPIRGRRVTINIAAQAIIVEPFIKDPVLRGQGLISASWQSGLTNRPSTAAAAWTSPTSTGRSASRPHLQDSDRRAPHAPRQQRRAPLHHQSRLWIRCQTVPAGEDLGRASLREPGNKYPRTHAMASRAMEHLCRIAAVLCVSDYSNQAPGPRSQTIPSP